MGGFRFGREFGGCGNVARNICEQAIQSNDFTRFHFGKPRLFRGTPLPPVSETRARRGFHKIGLQNLEPQRVESQNLENTVVGAPTALLEATALALTMFCSSGFAVKVRCHMVLVEIPRDKA